LGDACTKLFKLFSKAGRKNNENQEGRVPDEIEQHRGRGNYMG